MDNLTGSPVFASPAEAAGNIPGESWPLPDVFAKQTGDEAEIDGYTSEFDLEDVADLTTESGARNVEQHYDEADKAQEFSSEDLEEVGWAETVEEAAESADEADFEADEDTGEDTGDPEFEDHPDNIELDEYTPFGEADAFEIEEGEVEEGEVEEGEVEEDELQLAAATPVEHEAFPSGLLLHTRPGPIRPREEHWDPNNVGLPLYDTGADVRRKKLATNFTVGELVSSGGRPADRARISVTLVRCLQAIRDRVGRPVYVTSGYRSWARNVEVYRRAGKEPTHSRHCSGQAADITIRGLTGMQIAKLALDSCGDRIGIGIGKTFAHIDVRGTWAVWTYTGINDAQTKAEIEAYRRARRPAPSPADVRVAVIGGGFAGLMAAWSLQSGNFDVALFEASGRLGGRVRTDKGFIPGKVVEAGAELIGANHTTWIQLARTFGLKREKISTDEDYKTANLRVRLLLGGRELNRAQKSEVEREVKRVQEIIGREAKSVPPLQPWTVRGAATLDAMSIAKRFDEKDMFGPQSTMARTYLEYLIANDNCADVSKQSYLGLLTAVSAGRMGNDMLGYWTHTETHRCAGGNEQLAHRLAKGLRDIRLNSPVGAVTLGSKAIRVEYRRPDGGHAEAFDFVVLAGPPATWPRIHSSPPFDAAKFSVAHGRAVKFLSAFDREFWKKNELAPSAKSDRIGSVWESTDKQNRQKGGFGLTVYSGGPFVLDSASYMTQMEQLYPGYLAELKKHQLIDWPKQPFIMSGYAVPAPGQVTTVVKNLNGSFEDRIFFAGEQTSPGFFGYMEGALQSGVLAASRVAISSTRKMPFRIRSAPPPAGQSKPSRSTAGARR